jgi:hypothetical protein
MSGAPFGRGMSGDQPVRTVPDERTATDEERR